MNDLYGATGAAIAAGNSRMDVVRDYNKKVKEHNDSIHNTIQGLRDQAQNAAQIKEIKDTAMNLWAGKDIPGKVKEFNDYFADKTGGNAKGANPTENTSNKLSESEDAPNVRDGMAEGQETTEAGGEAVSEGARQGETVSEVAEGADTAVAEGLETSLKGAKAGAKAGLKAGEEAAESFASKASGVLGKVGVLGSAAVGGMDLYEDIKHDKIEGNNNWEKASNILQIGGSIADVAGTLFPPAKLLGGVLDIASGITDSVGEKVEESQTEQDLKGQEQSETETTETVEDVERQEPQRVARTALTAVTQRLQ